MVDAILPSKKRKQSAPAVAAAPPLTKAERKKLDRLAEEKRKKAERAALFATLNTTKISKEEFSVMRSSKAIGQVCNSLCLFSSIRLYLICRGSHVP
jgi:hypothetical protein